MNIRDYVIYHDGKIYRKSTLAHWLDTRTISYGEPTPAHLPEKLNVFQFLVDKLLRSHIVSVRIKENCIQKDLTQAIPRLKDCIPAGDKILVTLETTPLENAITLDKIQEEVTMCAAYSFEDTVYRKQIDDSH
ncbi:MAG: hypothetical protein Q4D38_00210 [Planctomycetia bacterium]|nr:hypothetical protein [Planctomycetia bacterium]